MDKKNCETRNSNFPDVFPGPLTVNLLSTENIFPYQTMMRRSSQYTYIHIYIHRKSYKTRYF